MKTMLGWLGDPYLHLVAIGAIVVAVGSNLGSERAAADEASSKCDTCHKYHDEAKSCLKVVNPSHQAE